MSIDRKIHSNQLTQIDRRIVMEVLSNYWVKNVWTLALKDDLPRYQQLAQAGWIFQHPTEPNMFGPCYEDIPRDES